MSEVKWEELTQGERDYLLDIQRLKYIEVEYVNMYARGLQSHGLVEAFRVDHRRSHIRITDAGRALVAAAQAAETPAGDVYSMGWDELREAFDKATAERDALRTAQGAFLDEGRDSAMRVHWFDKGIKAGIIELLDVLETAINDAGRGERLPAIERVLIEYRERYGQQATSAADAGSAGEEAGA